jgi:uncharacterized membrane protein
VLKVGFRTLRTTITIASLDPERGITWSSAGDEGQTLTFGLDQDHEDTTATLTVTYTEPGGIAGSLIAPFVEQTVQHRADAALERLRDHVTPD